jgi:hypothetical protein
VRLCIYKHVSHPITSFLSISQFPDSYSIYYSPTPSKSRKNCRPVHPS